MGIISEILFTSAPPLTGCGKGKVEPAAVKPEDQPLTFTRQDISAILSRWGPNLLDECDLHRVPSLLPLGEESIRNFWNEAANHIVNVDFSNKLTKACDDIRRGGTPNYTSADCNDLAQNIRNALAALSPNQREAVTARLAEKLEKVFGKPLNILHASQEEDYHGYCKRRFFLFAPTYPSPISLEISPSLKVTYADLLAIIQGVATAVAPPPPPIERPQVLLPAFIISRLSGNQSGTPGKSYQVEIHGQAENLLKGGNLPDGLIISFGDDIRVGSPELTADGTLKIKIKIEADADPGKRNVVIKLGEQEIGRLDNAFTVKKRGGPPKLPLCEDAYPPALQPAMEAAKKCR